jgi:hypothetical protein
MAYTYYVAQISDGKYVVQSMGSFWLDCITYITAILNTSKGRDKILGLIQYSCFLYKECMKDYLTNQKIRDWPVSLKNAKNIQVSMTNGRKIFRFLKWLDEIPKIMKCISDPNADRVVLLKLFSHTCSLLYYFFDNLVWAASIGIISKMITFVNVKWAVSKDFMSLIRCIVEIMISALVTKRAIQYEKECEEILKSAPSKIVSLDSSTQHTFKLLLQARRHRRYKVLELAQHILRVIMLCKSLRLPGHIHLSTIFMSVCALTSSYFSLFKMITEKPEKLNLKKERHNRLDVE